MSPQHNLKSAPGQCKLRIEETETRDAIVTDTPVFGPQRTIAYVAIGAESWGPMLAAAPDLMEALSLFVKQWNACGPNSDFGRYFNNVRTAAVAALAKAAL